MFGNLPKGDGGECKEPDWEKKLVDLRNQEKVVNNFLDCVKELVDIYGRYAFEKVSFLEAIAWAMLLQHSLLIEIPKVIKKIDKE